MLGIAQPALADSFTVNSTLDNGDGTCQDAVAGDCTLRDAVTDANADSNYSNIYFASGVTGTITLGSSIEVNYPTYIYGPGPSALTISGGNNNGIFNTNMVNTGDYFTVDGLTLANGSRSKGGAIYDANSTLDVHDSVLTGNSAFVGGAIYEYGFGGVPYTTFSTLTNNTAVYGGGIAGFGVGLLGATTFNNNTAYGVGGAVLTVPLGPFGGRIYDSTLAGNRAGNFAGGVYAYYAYSTNSILANNGGGDVSSAYFFPNFSLIRDPGMTSISGTSDITGLDPQLGGPANNGGLTPTMKPAAGSPVVDKGNGTIQDQRGVPRPVDNPNVPNASGGNGADIGSVELTLAEGPQPPAPVVHKKKKCKKKKKKHHSAEAAKKKKCKKKKKKKHSVVASASAAQARDFFSAEIPDRHRFRRATRSGDGHFGNGTQRSGAFDWADHAWRR
jgi:CSLREA domain-containing protein